MATTWTVRRNVTTTQTTLGQRFALDHAAAVHKRDRSGQIAQYIEEGLQRDGYRPDEYGKWVPAEPTV